MKNWFWIFLSLAFLTATICSLVFSKNGLLDLYRLQAQMQKTREHIKIIESSNEELRRQIDLVQLKDQTALEYQIRVRLGLLKPGERLYLE